MTTEIGKSHELGAYEAAEMIESGKFKTTEELAAFTIGEDRKTVLAACAAKVAEIAAAIAASNTPPPPAPTPPAIPTVLKQDSWRYHEEQEPRVFKAGETVPEGWHSGQSMLKRLWTRDANGAFSRIDKG